MPDEKKNVLFIKTAAEVYGKNPEWLAADRNSLRAVGFNVHDYSLTNKSASDFKKELNKHEIIFISGGNTYYLLEKIQQSHTLKIIKNAIEKGMPYIGSSAGSVIAGPDIKPVGKLDDIKKAPSLKGLGGLGLVDFIVVPHWGWEKCLNELIENLRENYVKDYKFILLTNYQYVSVKGGMYQIVEAKHKP